MKPTPKLEAALLEAQKAIQSVGKNAWNDFSKYKYASADQIILAARQALHGAGVSVRRDSFEFKMMHGMNWVVCQFKVVHPASMESKVEAFPWPIINDKKPFDKILGGALTTAWRYWLRDLLSIPQVDPEEDMFAQPDHPPGPPDDRFPDGPPETRHQAAPPATPRLPSGPAMATREQFAEIKRLMEITGALPAAVEASFGPAKELTEAMADKVIDYLNGLGRGKGGAA